MNRTVWRRIATSWLWLGVIVSTLYSLDHDYTVPVWLALLTFLPPAVVWVTLHHLARVNRTRGLFCPLCTREGNDRVLVETLSEDLHGEPHQVHYDNRGVAHLHDPNVYVVLYGCVSAKHIWSALSTRQCLACGWKPPAEVFQEGLSRVADLRMRSYS